MGIRFRCPNGHKLNVKSFLAGKRGVCPDCGQTFRIPPDGTDDSGVLAMPLESRRNGSARGGEDNLEESDFETAVAVAAAAVTDPLHAAAEGVVFLPPMPAASSSAPAAPTVPVTIPAPTALVAPMTKPAGPAASGPGPQGIPPEVPEIFFPPSATAPAAARPAPVAIAPATASPPPPPAPARVDPIAEAPNARWFVRPPGGLQDYGPARADVMRRWIVEGRVSSDSLVWREDWNDWREAGQIFPALATTPHSGAAAQAPSALPFPNSPAAAVGPSALRSAERKPVGKRGNNDLAVAALVCLVLVCLILVTVLVVVLSQGSA